MNISSHHQQHRHHYNVYLDLYMRMSGVIIIIIINDQKTKYKKPKYRKKTKQKKNTLRHRYQIYMGEMKSIKKIQTILYREIYV